MKHILFICLLFFCIACEENKSVDPTLMPEATATGTNTFGCLVDGWVSVSGRWGVPVAEFTQLEDSTGMTISAQIGFDSYLRFSIPNPKQGETLPYTNVSFDNLRAMGAFLISAEKQNGKITKLRIYPEQGGTLRLASPFGTDEAVVTGNAGDVTNEDGILSFETRKGEWVDIKTAG